MNTLCKAVAGADLVADSYCTPFDLPYRQTQAKAQIAANRLLGVIEVRLGPAAAHEFATYCEGFGMVEPLRVFTADDLHRRADSPSNIAEGTYGYHGAYLEMRRLPDGIWRIYTGLERISPIDLRHEIDLYQRRAALYERFETDVKEARVTNVEYILDGLKSQDSQISREWELKELAGEGQAEPPVPDRASLESADFDKSTVQGAIGAYKRAFDLHDKKGLVDFYYSEYDTGGNLAEANAKRILAALRLKDAVDQKFKGLGESFASDDTRLITPADMVWWCSIENENGNHAIGIFEDNSQVSFRKVDGVWKLDITPPKSTTPTELANRMEYNIQLLDSVTAKVLANGYQQISQVRAALVSAKLTTN